MFMIVRRLAPRSANDALLANTDWTRTPRVSIPCFDISLAQDHGTCLSPAKILSYERWRGLSLTGRGRRTPGHDSGCAETAVVEARVGSTRSGIIIPLLKLRHPSTTMGHGGWTSNFKSRVKDFALSLVRGSTLNRGPSWRGEARAGQRSVLSQNISPERGSMRHPRYTVIRRL